MRHTTYNWRTIIWTSDNKAMLIAVDTEDNAIQHAKLAARDFARFVGSQAIASVDSKAWYVTNPTTEETVLFSVWSIK